MPKLAVLGRPISHSRSPAMQNAALAELGLAPEWSYEAIDVAPEGFEALVRSLPGRGFAGVNVTVPHKLAALAIADSATAAAREIGAANTLTFTAKGIEAENTDAVGLLEALPEPPAAKRALVLGAGGSARAVIWALKRGGAEVEIWNRTPEKAEALAAEFGVRAAADPGPFELVVNCTTVGLEQASRRPTGEPSLKPLPIDADSISAKHVVVDLVYGSYATPLARLAQACGARFVDGREVLVRQGAASLRIWTGLEPPLDVMRAAIRD